ncbi:MAG: hypothetical protein H8E12_15410 [Rhodobacteraceae bacterium]|nr:hypothetical protein [Paracoccaceae bacterium]
MRNKIEFAEMVFPVSEELNLLGFSHDVKDHKIIMHSIVGCKPIEMAFDTPMENVYRCIYIYGMGLERWGIEMRIKESHYAFKQKQTGQLNYEPERKE